MPLKNLSIGRRVTDLKPLKGMQLEFLGAIARSRLSDLSPLKGMPLKGINCPEHAGVRPLAAEGDAAV